MGCPTCGGGAKHLEYPRMVKMPDGTSVEVTSLQHERAERDKAYSRMRSQGDRKREEAVRRGWSAEKA